MLLLISFKVCDFQNPDLPTGKKETSVVYSQALNFHPYRRDGRVRQRKEKTERSCMFPQLDGACIGLKQEAEFGVDFKIFSLNTVVVQKYPRSPMTVTT